MTQERSCILEPEVTSTSAHFYSLTDVDRQVLAGQFSGRKGRLARILGVMRRCRFGCPQVVCCRPLIDGELFPTIFWLTCPFLDRLCGRLESHGAVTDMSEALDGKEEEWYRFHKDYAATRKKLLFEETLPHTIIMETRASFWESGVGGIDFTKGHRAPKCLHLQLATWIGMGYHPLAYWFVQKLTSLECVDGECACFNLRDAIQ